MRLPHFKHFGNLTLGLSSLPFAKFWLSVKHKASASDLPHYNIFVPQKVPLLKIYYDVITCDLWFGPPSIKNPGYAYDTLK